MSARQLFISQLGACTRVVNAEIKNQIIEAKAVDTGRMKNNTKVKVGYDFNREVFTIQSVKSTDYYIFIDEGTIYIKARNITDNTLDTKRVQNAFDKLYDKWIDYIVERQFE